VQRPHVEIRKALYRLLYAVIEKLRSTRPDAKLGKVQIEMGYLMAGEPRSWLQPDVSLTHPGQPGQRYYEGAPLMVFEVVSEYDTARHRCQTGNEVHPKRSSAGNRDRAG